MEFECESFLECITSVTQMPPPSSLLLTLGALSAVLHGARGASAAADVDPYRKPFYVESGAALTPAGAAGFFSGTKCGEVNTFTIASTQGSKLIVDLVVPSTSNRRQDDRWGMKIKTAAGVPIFNSFARWCKQPEDDRLRRAQRQDGGDRCEERGGRADGRGQVRADCALEQIVRWSRSAPAFLPTRQKLQDTAHARLVQRPVPDQPRGVRQRARRAGY